VLADHLVDPIAVTHTRVIIDHYGGPDALRVVEEELPEPKHGEVRVRVLAAGVSLPDVMMREGVHPETPRVPFTPGWDLVGVVDSLGAGVSGIERDQLVAALPITGAYAAYVCLPERELVPVPSGLDPAEAVSLILNYVTAYQMLHRSAKVSPGQRVLVHGASGGVGTALLQLGFLAGLKMYGTCSSRGAATVSTLGGIPIDYQHQDFVEEVRRLTGVGVDVVFDSIGGTHLAFPQSSSRRRKGRGIRPHRLGQWRTIGLRDAPSISPARALRGVHRGQLASARPEACGSLQHSDSQACPTVRVSRGSDDAVRAASRAENQTRDCSAISSGRGAPRTGGAGNRRRRRQVRPHTCQRRLHPVRRPARIVHTIGFLR
jgi:NADPH:quinone reductase-like Zn-dependent oxidoreductase